MILSTLSRNFFQNIFRSVNFALSIWQICCIQKSTLNVDISTKSCAIYEKFQEKLCDHIDDVIL